METLTPVQRVAVIAIGLALTALVALLLLPWVWKQIDERLPAVATPVTDAVSPAPLRVPDQLGFVQPSAIHYLPPNVILS